MANQILKLLFLNIGKVEFNSDLIFRVNDDRLSLIRVTSVSVDIH